MWRIALPKKLRTKLGLSAIALLLSTLGVAGSSTWGLTAWRDDTRALVWMGRGRRVAIEYANLAERWVAQPSAALESELRSSVAGAAQRHALLESLRHAQASPLLCEQQLTAQAARFNDVTRPAVNTLLARPSGLAATAVVSTVRANAQREVEELWTCVDATEQRAERLLDWLRATQAGFLLMATASFASLLVLARRTSERLRDLAKRSERLADGDVQALLPLGGEDELADVSASFGTTVSRIRAYFETEHEALQQRLETVMVMNAQLAAASSSSGQMLAVDAAALAQAQAATGIIGSIPPPSIPPRDANVVNRRVLREVGASGGARLLLVDDDPQVLRGFGRVLTAKGYTVVTAKRGREALKALEGESFDVIISDIAMPDMNGIQLLREVRQRDLLVPVVLVTGSPDVRTAAEAVEFGAFQYLVKPVQKDSLLRVIQHAERVHEVARTRQQVSALLGQEAAVAADRAGLEATFDRALDTLWMAYQPIVDVRAQKIFGYEALLRSVEPSLPHPGAVLDAAERLGRLEQLGRTVRARAAEPMQSMADGPLLFVNLHVRDLVDPALSDPNSPLAKMARRVVLEITERVSLDEVRDARLRVAALREMGFRIAVDDMGAGYAGLSSFAVLEPEIVKLDMSLIRDVHLSPVRQKVVRSMAALTQDMGIAVIAEGVETSAERATLEELGCSLLQGYLFAKPGKPFPLVAW